MKTDRSNENGQNANSTMDPRVLSAYLFLIFVVVFYFMFRGRGENDVDVTSTNTFSPITETREVPLASATVLPTNTDLSDITHTPSPDETQYDFFAGFTNNPIVPFILIHESGEFLGFSLEENAQVSKIIWQNPDGLSAIIFTDANGLPQKAVVGDYIVKYSNYTRETVDLTIISKDGSRELLRVEHQIERFRPSNSYFPQVVNLISYRGASKAIDAWEVIDQGLFALGIAGCLTAAAGIGTLAPPALVALGVACAGPLIHNEIILRQASGESIGNLEQYESIADATSCSVGSVILQDKTSIIDCVGLALDYANSFQVPNIVIPPTKSIQKYP